MLQTRLYRSLNAITSLRYVIIVLLLSSCLTVASNPRLTIVAVVEGLHQENLKELRDFWQEGGLRTLSEEAFQTNLSFPHMVYGGAESTATLMTGTTPNVHGISMDYYFNRSNRRIHPILADDRENGIGTPDRLSARSLLAPTLSDKMRMRYGKQCKIYALGIHAANTLIMGGHAANACCWIGNPTPYDSLRWVSTSYYSEGLPSAADDMNMSGRFNQLASRVWTPRMDIAMYNHATEREKKKSFSYPVQEHLSQTPTANTLVVELALSLQEKEQLGKDLTPDLLLLELTTISPKAQSDHIATAEQEDMYLWLNQDIGYLMEQLNKRIGKENYRLVIVGKPSLGIGKEQLQLANIPCQYFNVEHAAALTSTYLMALYGHERWIDGGYGQSIYLNRTLIEQKRLSISTIQQQVANFLLEFAGVQAAFPSYDVYHSPLLASTINKHSAGDVVFVLEPGWQLTHNEDQAIDYVIEQEVQVPLLLWSGAAFAHPNYTMDATHLVQLLLQ
jgi:hypothetical protein